MSGPVSEPAATAAPEKRVSWAELFFDLVFVVAVTQVATVIEHHHDAAGLVHGLVVFVPIYWTWVGASVLANQQDIARPSLRLRLFAVALGGIFMALAIGRAYESTGMMFALAYWLSRLVLLSTIVVSLVRRRGTVFNPYVLSAVVTGPLFVIGALLPDTHRLLLWVIAALVDLAGPTLFRSRMRQMHIDAPHLAERFGLFVLIALGESVVAVGTSADPDHLGVPEVAAVATAFALSCGLWWVYFQFAADAVRFALTTAAVQLDIVRLVLSYGHLAFIGAIIVISVGMHDAVAHPLEPIGWSVAALLCGGTAVYLATFGFTRWSMFHLVSTTRLITAAVALALIPVVHGLPSLVALALVTVVLVVLNAIEMLRVARIGWRARLADRAAADQS